MILDDEEDILPYSTTIFPAIISRIDALEGKILRNQDRKPSK